MNIGGYDKTYEIEDADQLQYVAWQAIKTQVWPDAIIEIDRSPDKKDSVNFFIYKDRQALKDWVDKGATDANANQMIHMLTSANSITFVFGSSAHPSTKIVLREVELYIKRR